MRLLTRSYKNLCIQGQLLLCRTAQTSREQPIQFNIRNIMSSLSPHATIFDPAQISDSDKHDHSVPVLGRITGRESTSSRNDTLISQEQMVTISSDKNKKKKVHFPVSEQAHLNYLPHQMNRITVYRRYLAYLCKNAFLKTYLFWQRSLSVVNRPRQEEKTDLATKIKIFTI